MKHTEYNELKAAKVYRSFWSAGKLLNKEQRAIFYEAILDYTFTGIEPDLDDALAALFELGRPNIDAANRDTLNGLKGSRRGVPEGGSEGGFPRGVPEGGSEADKGRRKKEKGKRNKDGEERMKEGETEGEPKPSPARPSRSIRLKDGSYWEPDDQETEKLRRDFPKVDVERELSFMAAWAEKTPEKRPTRRSVVGFARKWLGDECEKARSGTRSKPTAYKAFPQRDYDYEDLEKEILQKQKEAKA